MSIKVNLIQVPGFKIAGPGQMLKADAAVSGRSVETTTQTQRFSNVEIQNGYGTATSVSVSPGFGATVTTKIHIEVNTVSEETFKQIINEVKNSSSYKENSNFRKEVDSASYAQAASSSSGIFGWLVGKKSSAYSNNHSNITTDINAGASGDASDDHVVANTVANIMVKNQSKVIVDQEVTVTGKLLTPSPTVIAVQSTVFSFTTAEGNSSSVSMLDQEPLVPVNATDGTVSQNTLAPGAKLNMTGSVGS